MKSPLLAEARIDRNLQFWQPRSPRKLTREDARQIATNMTRFFGFLPNGTTRTRHGQHPNPMK